MRFLAAAVLVSLTVSPVLAAFPCDELWGERNAIYKDAGYCFRTERAIRAFGNSGCKYDELADVPLSARQRADIADIQRQERENGCAR
ncbi:UNVERIFIED_ORG: hypothetical protein M2438_003984 [Methylobacterium sp. SuP10 SLI 274]|uniref:YARHG domain-containing protein n=1 Tax=Methylorubrum extorquens TaxID=408 RepID=UPI00209E62AC|nr:YARHG domain-containing protein [Methylorubrum extorquens]MDF9865240.1 hypothetical protein [Methylorubrum pseudosasae]MDH6638809.1 hypothetical protein [Methylobacterium sp. SuP10 SLI 274]MDH6667996.1 hypothetical protein [Methylorubrum zatmanii]MCP1559889.1 hypothetical protein [Methylorubrum extorquens]MDF9793534.1 hypothetical protein [Methylorubrum extorquens]